MRDTFLGGGDFLSTRDKISIARYVCLNVMGPETDPVEMGWQFALCLTWKFMEGSADTTWEEGAR